jgi:putative sigma-54 modulation protein
MAAKSKFEEEGSAYRVEIIGRNVQVTEAMKNYALNKLSKIEEFHRHIMHVHVTLDIQKLEHVCTIIAKFNHFNVKAMASSSDMYVSIDKAVHRLENKIRKWKSHIEDHQRKKLSVVDMQVNVIRRPYDELEEINSEIEAKAVAATQTAFFPPQVMGTETIPLKTLTTEEALMKIDLNGDTFLVYRSEEDRKLKVMYRRKDGHYGIIQPE